MLRELLGNLYFNRTLNNYQLIKMHFNREQTPEEYGRVVERRKGGGEGRKSGGVCVDLEYRI